MICLSVIAWRTASRPVRASSCIFSFSMLSSDSSSKALTISCFVRRVVSSPMRMRILFRFCHNPSKSRKAPISNMPVATSIFSRFRNSFWKARSNVLSLRLSIITGSFFAILRSLFFRSFLRNYENRPAIHCRAELQAPCSAGLPNPSQPGFGNPAED